MGHERTFENVRIDRGRATRQFVLQIVNERQQGLMASKVSGV